MLLRVDLGLVGQEGLRLGLMRLLRWLRVLVGRRLVKCLQWRWNCLLWVMLQVWQLRWSGSLLGKVVILWLRGL